MITFGAVIAWQAIVVAVINLGVVLQAHDAATKVPEPATIASKRAALILPT